MPEQKTITRTFDDIPASPKQAIEKLLEMSELAEKLLGMPEWRHKEFQSVQITFNTPHYKPERIEGENKFRLAEVRNSTLEFGSHQGSRLDDIPLTYLTYLYEAQRELNDRLKFYLNHPTIRQEREQE